MNDDLARADIPYTAKEYYAKAILSAMLGILVAIFAMTIDSALLIIGGLLMAVYLFFKNFDQLKDTLENKYKIVEMRSRRSFALLNLRCIRIET